MDQQNHLTGRRIAILIGVNSLETPDPSLEPLKAPENDVSLLAATLQQPACGFDIILPLLGDSANIYNIQRTIINNLVDLDVDDTLVIYFSGHACVIPISDEVWDVFLVTHDFNKNIAKMFPSHYLSVGNVRRDYIDNNSLRVGKVLLILDCCYAGWADIGDIYFGSWVDKLKKTFLTIKSNNPSSHTTLRKVFMGSRPYEMAYASRDESIFTLYLCEALDGRISGEVTLDRIKNYINPKLPESQRAGISGWDNSTQFYLANHLLSNNINIDSGINTSESLSGFDQNLCPKSSLTDCSMEIMQKFFDSKRVSQHEDYHKWNSLKDMMIGLDLLYQGRLKYATLLCFGSNPQNWIESATTTCVVWQGTSTGNIVTKNEYRRGIISQYESTINFLKMNLYLKRDRSEEYQNEEWEIPFEALRETIVNAFIHREYNKRSDSIKVYIFADRIEVTNPGLLPEGTTPEDFLAGGGSMPRNPIIARIFSLKGLAEGASSGMQKINEKLKEAGLEEAKFEQITSTQRFKVTIKRSKEMIVDKTLRDWYFWSGYTSKGNDIKHDNILQKIWRLISRFLSSK
jgi:hypothetical protein